MEKTQPELEQKSRAKAFLLSKQEEETIQVSVGRGTFGDPQSAEREYQGKELKGKSAYEQSQKVGCMVCPSRA